MESLLGQFYSRIKGSQEDIASFGLTYVLQRSSTARQALSKIIQMDNGLIFENINYSTQNVGEKLERPDISGIDKSGNEVIILEAKFWSSLTDNQPVEYLRRLGLGNKSILMFIVPTLRVRPLFNEIQIRLKQTGENFVPDNTNHLFTLNNQKVIIKTWDEILQTIRLHLVQAHEQTLLSDIDQIIGFCDTIDNNAFQPYQSEDFSPSIAKKINSFYDLADKVIDELKKRGLASTDGLKSTPQKYGYSKYFNMNTMRGVILNVSFDFWEKVADTPIWLSFFNTHWERPEFKAKVKNAVAKYSIVPHENNKRELFIPIYPLIDKTEDSVVNDMANQIIRLTNELDTK
jgi:hypothetical protein